nr:unnamed protein product [uncultured bacterium]
MESQTDPLGFCFSFTTLLVQGKHAAVLSRLAGSEISTFITVYAFDRFYLIEYNINSCICLRTYL